ncbi:vegetative incompatibility protein HET-E-1 [Aspergillus udagawae]|uniref:Vegetative incompatibility protein HET-E-1 n=1 Tax=Aspergillus udagawae TaxID=91492 RepID=A0ABQ1AQU9_9EURO|nr:vegetative incompatibility protein HET-E-1 [Aspergillus udagawae]
MLNNNTTVLKFLPAQVLTDKRLRFLDSHVDHFNRALETQYPVHECPVPAESLVARLHRRIQDCVFGTAPTQNLVGAGGPVKTQNLYLLDAQSFETSNKYNVKDVVAVSPGLDDALAPSLIVGGQGVQEVDWSSSTPAPGRHFFIPYDWVAGSRDVICAVLRRDIIFARNDDLVIIRRGFDFTAEIHLKE